MKSDARTCRTFPNKFEHVREYSTCSSEDGRETFSLPTRKRKHLKLCKNNRKNILSEHRTEHFMSYREVFNVRNVHGRPIGSRLLR